MRQVEGVVVVPGPGGIPTRVVGHELPATDPKRVHIHHREGQLAELSPQLAQAGPETARVVALPAERWVDYYYRRTQFDRKLGRTAQPLPWVGAPYALGHQQAGGVYRTH